MSSFTVSGSPTNGSSVAWCCTLDAAETRRTQTLSLQFHSWSK